MESLSGILGPVLSRAGIGLGIDGPCFVVVLYLVLQTTFEAAGAGMGLGPLRVLGIGLSPLNVAGIGSSPLYVVEI